MLLLRDAVWPGFSYAKVKQEKLTPYTLSTYNMVGFVLSIFHVVIHLSLTTTL